MDQALFEQDASKHLTSYHITKNKEISIRFTNETVTALPRGLLGARLLMNSMRGNSVLSLLLGNSEARALSCVSWWIIPLKEFLLHLPHWGR